MVTPVHVVTGFLGAGKTTAILDTLARRPEGERWAVVVNEAGQVGVDGARLEAGGVTVREVAGGCVCCTAGLELKVALVRILREIKPDRLFVEPSGAARPWAVLDALRAPGMREAVEPRAVLCLVDPRRLGDPRLLASDVFREQVEVADVLIATHADVATADELARFEAFAAGMWPEKLAIGRTPAPDRPAALDPAWLALVPSARAHGFRPAGHPTLAADGRIWPASEAFDAARLELALQALVQPGVLPEGVERIKGLLRTTRGWRQVDGTPVELRWQPSPWRRDSRLEILAPPGEIDWAPVWASLEAALLSRALRAR